MGCVCGEHRRPGWDAEAGQAGSGCGPGLAGRNALLRPNLETEGKDSRHTFHKITVIPFQQILHDFYVD